MTPAETAALQAMLRTQAAVYGPFEMAGDDAPVPILAAHVNAALLAPGWCSCQDPSGPETREAYFQRHDGSHGWMCCHCRRITHTG